MDEVALQRRSEAFEAWQLRRDLEDAGLSPEDTQRLDSLEQRLDGRVYRVPADALPHINARIHKAEVAAARLGVLPPILQELDRRPELVAASVIGKELPVEVATLLLVGGTVAAGHDWEYLGMLSFDGTPQKLRTRLLSPKLRSAIAKEDLTQPACDHCKTNRRRKRSFLLLSPVGEIRQVGYRCLEDYIGDSPEEAARYAERLLDLADMLADSDSSLRRGIGIDPRSRGFFEPLPFLAWAAREVRLHGWVSRHDAWQGGGTATADQARQALLAHLDGSHPDEPNADDWETADKVCSWLRDLADGDLNHYSSYMRDLALLGEEPLIAYRSLPLLASALSAYNRHVERLAEAAASDYVGDIKQRIEVDVEVLSAWGRETSFGPQTIYTFKDSDGNRLVWFATANVEMRVGEQYRIRGTVKRHEEYKGTKRTLLTNCRLLSAD